MDRLDVTSIADAVNGSTTPDEAWQRFSAVLGNCGLKRVALFADLRLDRGNPFASDQCRSAFGVAWDAGFDTLLRSFTGDIRRSCDPGLVGVRPMLVFLSFFRSSLLVENRKIAERPNSGLVGDISRRMIDLYGQYQMIVFPLMNPATGVAAMLVAWGDEDRPDFCACAEANRDALHMAGHFFLAAIETRWPEHGLSRLAGKPEIPLSERERQVLAIFSRGAQTAEVADRLKLSERSVREYVTRARRKLGARSRSAAIAKAVMDGYLE